jgi:ABC-type multidrug transport system ATPase subunit
MDGDTGILDVSDVCLRAGGVDILEAIDLRLHPGELCALIGPSGAGKSSLIKVLLGLRAPYRGTVRLGDSAISRSGPVGYVPQDDALHRSLTVRRALTFAARLRMPEAREATRQRRVEEVLRQVGLSDRARLRIRKLSGGQRKRVSLALELLTEPGLMILDEPTSGLDPGLEAKMMSLFLEISRSGRIVLVATHAMQSLRLCHALMVIVAGRVAFLGEPAEALSFFRVQEFRDIFDELPKIGAAAWHRRYAGSETRRRFAGRSTPRLERGRDASVHGGGAFLEKSSSPEPPPQKTSHRNSLNNNWSRLKKP